MTYALQVGQPDGARQGFMRSRVLAPFLNQLATEAEPGLQTDDTRATAANVLKLAEHHAAQKTWLTLLGRALSASGMEASSKDSQQPIAGGSSVVFQVSNHICKFVAKVSSGGPAETHP